jgi:hypothetical protein
MLVSESKADRDLGPIRRIGAVLSRASVVSKVLSYV